MIKDYAPPPLLALVIRELASGRTLTVAELLQNIRAQSGDIPCDSLEKELKMLESRGLIETIEPSFAVFADYLKSWRFGLKFWFFTAATISTLAIVELLAFGFPLVVINWVASTFLVLIAPGYALTSVLFPSRMSNLNRFALTVAMSLFIVPVVGLVFNVTPLGIHSQPIAAFIGALTLGLLIMGSYREFLAKSHVRP